MSAKIYDGLKSTIQNPFETATAITEIIEPIFFKKVQAMEKLILEADEETPLKEIFRLPQNVERGRSTDISAYNVITYWRNTHHFDFEGWNIGYTIQLWGSANPSDPPLVIVVAGSNPAREYRQALIESGVITDYEYWDNADWPENMAKEEWMQRKKDWDYAGRDASVSLNIEYPTRSNYYLNVHYPPLD